MEPEAPGKKTVAVCILDDIFFANTGGIEVAGHTFDPLFQILCGIRAGNRFSGRTRRRMHSDQFCYRHGTQAEGIIVPEIIFDGKGQLGNIFQSFEVSGFDPHFFELIFIKRYLLR